MSANAGNLAKEDLETQMGKQLSKRHVVGEPIEFTGYVDDFGQGVACAQQITALQFSLDDGAHWTDYSTAGSLSQVGISWHFTYTPHTAGLYHLKVRAVRAGKSAAETVMTIPFRVHSRHDTSLPWTSADFCSDTVTSSLQIRALGGGPLEEAKVFRSGELCGATSADLALIKHLGIKAIYDLRTAREIAESPDAFIDGVCTYSFAPDAGRRHKNAKKRLVAGVIGEYGAPGERMRANYRKYAREYPMVGVALRTMADQKVPVLVHCANGKDRTGVLCAVLQRIAGVSLEDIYHDYLVHNQLNAQKIAEEAAELEVGMTIYEKEILQSFLEVRSEYLDAFFEEVEKCFGSFEDYVRSGLALTATQIESLCLLATGVSNC